MTGSPQQPQPQPPQQKQQKRAWSIFWWLIVLLGLSSVAYGYAHVCTQNQRQQSNLVVSKNIEITQGEIASAKQLLEDKPNVDLLRDKLKVIEPSIKQILEQAQTVTDATQQQKLTQAGEDIRTLIQQIDSIGSLNPEQLRTYAIQFLTLAEKELQTIQENEKDTSFFWRNPPLLWVEIAFWGWVGTILYLLSEIYTYYKADPEQQKFIELTPWYFITLLRGTFVVFMILLGTTTINVGFGQAVNFSEAPATLYVFLAGVLGYFNRMAKEQLIIIVQAVFSEAWKRANPDEITAAPTSLKITSDKTELNYEGTATIKVESGQSVDWSTTPPNLGSFNPSQGGETVYKAPTEADAKDSQGNTVTQVTITAISVDDSSQTAEMAVSLKTA